MNSHDKCFLVTSKLRRFTKPFQILESAKFQFERDFPTFEY